MVRISTDININGSLNGERRMMDIPFVVLRTRIIFSRLPSWWPRIKWRCKRDFHRGCQKMYSEDGRRWKSSHEFEQIYDAV